MMSEMYIKRLYLKMIFWLIFALCSACIEAATITQSYTNSNAASVDPRSNNPVNRSVTVAGGDFPTVAEITDVNIAIRFDKRDNNGGNCNAYNGGSVYNNEITFRLTSPTGTIVNLVNANTGYYSGNGHPGNITVTFDDEGIPFVGTTPLAGIFQPQGNLSDFDSSTNIAGTWTLFMSDSAGRDPLCFFSFTLTIEATTDADISVTKTDSSGTYTPGGTSIYVIEVSNSGINVDNLIVNDPLPAGVRSASWICSSSGGANCDTAAGIGGINNVTVDIPNNGMVTFTLTVNWSADPTDY